MRAGDLSFFIQDGLLLEREILGHFKWRNFGPGEWLNAGIVTDGSWKAKIGIEMVG
jgi:hypothetical protein